MPQPARAPALDPASTTLLLTRPKASADRFAAQVTARFGAFAEVLVSPLLTFAPVAVDLDVAPRDVLALTSEAGARRAAELLTPQGRCAYCVGAQTARVAAALGFTADIAGGDVIALAARLIQVRPEGTIWHLSGRHRRGDLAATLSAVGLHVETRTVYDQHPTPLTPAAQARLAEPGPVLAPVFSPRTATLLGQAVNGAAADLRIAAISAAAAAPLAHLPHAVASTPDATGVLAAIDRVIAPQRPA